VGVFLARRSVQHLVFIEAEYYLEEWKMKSIL
jgi:hypothetical protein